MWPHRLEQWRQFIESAAEETALEPALIAAIMDRESLGGVGLTPKGPTGTGDYGNGLGLMQLDKRYHDLTPEQWQDPASNILIGAWVLRDNLDELDQNMPAAICSYNASIRRVRELLANVKDATVAQLDTLTTGRNYVSDVLERVQRLREDDSPTPGVA